MSDITVSKQTESLLHEVGKLNEHTKQHDVDIIEVSKTVSFFAIAYERLRNVIEFKDDYIIRRNAINRIIRRRLAFNPSLTNEALSIAKEIVWAGYLPTNKLPESKVDKLESIIRWYIALRDEIIKGEPEDKRNYYADFIHDLLVCQIEELFAEHDFAFDKLFVFYMYQVLNPTVTIEGLSEEDKNFYFYIATEQVLLKSDEPYLRFHLMRLLFEDLLKSPPSDFSHHVDKLRHAFHLIDTKIKYPINRKVRKYLLNQRPPYLVLKDFFSQPIHQVRELIADEAKFKSTIESICREKYESAKAKLRRAGVRSIIYIFFTKMIFVFLAEYPLLVRLNEPIDPLILGINALFPPIFMMLLVTTVDVPDEENTERIFSRLRTFMYGVGTEKVNFKVQVKLNQSIFRRMLFWIFYLVTFGATFLLIDNVLDIINFTWLSKIVFFFFLTAVAFFGYRVRQIAKEYIVNHKETILSPIVDFFMVPLITVGKWLSNEISKINILIFIFDFLIEAPFKILFDVIEEWIGFLRNRKEEIV
ncbi:hypothetical protein COU89_03750 [Candidatus Roizmanbacteria bacterium CG10_big_fil_rev_8_21_14_0_10_45_7]|uniref:Uncharacterized protein n=1 Tax=Candidatus Roizmanbacteria bacterium CG10_big_fil_rev_8_21_14_0_10_45_7 TaxID=1974854 RepID=A0A2M8KTX1_9BACT|nr:MAG: hypothetical protein COU89_03750 [Candidatus Roizmanbacteria bacterium CG10_big_fil_rev_8_21_14_0_10_45_7]